ncbi:hypothetical protein ALI22I_05400 [Saccharothrix sp. ALI-22-I]|nr:hypothetical protein ALI22I_05400 [Saccharothrix sp. ALI-22-I]
MQSSDTPQDKTLGVPLFQEQVMQIAIDAAGFSPGEADELRRAMGSKRALSKMDRLRDRLYRGAAANGIHGELADKVFLQVQSFSGYGFPQSHALAFAHLVFTSAWLKCYHPAAFCAALRRSAPRPTHGLLHTPIAGRRRPPPRRDHPPRPRQHHHLAA